MSNQEVKFTTFEECSFSKEMQDLIKETVTCSVTHFVNILKNGLPNGSDIETALNVSSSATMFILLIA